MKRWFWGWVLGFLTDWLQEIWYGMGFCCCWDFGFVGGMASSVEGSEFAEGSVEGGGSEWRGAEELPEHFRELFGQFEGRMEAMGFLFSHCQLTDDFVERGSWRAWEAVYYHAEEQVYAHLSVSRAPSRYDAVRVEYVTVFADGKRLVTVDGSGRFLIGALSNVRLNDAHGGNLEDQFRSHLSELSLVAANKTRVTFGPEEYVVSDDAMAKACCALLSDDKGLEETKEGNYRMRLGPVFRMACKRLLAEVKMKRMRKRGTELAGGAADDGVDVPAEVEADAYWAMERELVEAKDGVVGNVIMLVVSVVLFMVAFKTMFSLYTVMLLVGALFLHVNFRTF